MQRGQKTSVEQVVLTLRQIEAPADAMCLYGVLEHIRCDTGPEPKDRAAR